MLFKRKKSSINDIEINDIKSNIEKNRPVCRICRDDDSSSELIVPCHCRGTVKYIHRECLNEWLKTVNKAVLPFAHTSLINAKCNLCNYKYQWEGGEKLLFVLKYSNMISAIILCTMILLFGILFHIYTEQEFKYKAILDIPIEGMALCSSIIYTSPFSILFTILEFIIYYTTKQLIPFTFMLTIKNITLKTINECSTISETINKYKPNLFILIGKGIEFVLRPFCEKLNGNDQVYSVIQSSFKIVIVLLGIQYFIVLWFNILLVHFQIHSFLIYLLQKYELRIKEYTGSEVEDENKEIKNNDEDNNKQNENNNENKINKKNIENNNDVNDVNENTDKKK
jgi:hypothetical protein